MRLKQRRVRPQNSLTCKIHSIQIVSVTADKNHISYPADVIIKPEWRDGQRRSLRLHRFHLFDQRVDIATLTVQHRPDFGAFGRQHVHAFNDDIEEQILPRFI